MSENNFAPDDKQKPIPADSAWYLRNMIEQFQTVLEGFSVERDDYPTRWSDEEALSRFYGTAIQDDPPDGWDKAKLAQFFRGRASGETIVADNALGFIESILRVLDQPERFTYEAVTGQIKAIEEKYSITPSASSEEQSA